MSSRDDWPTASVTRWTAIAVGIAVLTMLVAAVGPELGGQRYAGRSEARQHATAVARDRTDTSVPSAQAVFEHSTAVPEDLPPTF